MWSACGISVFFAFTCCPCRRANDVCGASSGELQHHWLSREAGGHQAEAVAACSKQEFAVLGLLSMDPWFESDERLHLVSNDGVKEVNLQGELYTKSRLDGVHCQV